MELSQQSESRLEKRTGVPERRNRDSIPVKRVSRRYRRALHAACEKGFAKVVRELLAAGADVEDSTADGEHALHTVCKHFEPIPAGGAGGAGNFRDDQHSDSPDYMQCATQLIAAGAALEATFHTKRPIQFAAAREGADDLVAALLDAGSKPIFVKPKAPATGRSRPRIGVGRTIATNKKR